METFSDVVELKSKAASFVCDKWIENAFDDWRKPFAIAGAYLSVNALFAQALPFLEKCGAVKDGKADLALLSECIDFTISKMKQFSFSVLNKSITLSEHDMIEAKKSIIG